MAGLASFIIGDLKQREQEGEMENLKKQMALKAQYDSQAETQKHDFQVGDEQRRNEAIAKYLGLAPGKSYGPGTDISMSSNGVSVHQVDPKDTQMKNQVLNDKMLDNQRLETQALQNEYNKIIGKTRSQADALRQVKDLTANQNAMNEGQMKSQLARLAGEVGVLTDSDINRVLPSTLGGDVSKLYNYLAPAALGGGKQKTITPEQYKQIQDMLTLKEKTLSDQLASGETELRGRGQTLAPSLFQANKLDDVYKSLGLGAKMKTEGQAKPKTIIQNGHTYTLDPTTGTYK